MQLIVGGHVPVDMTPGPAPVCRVARGGGGGCGGY